MSTLYRRQQARRLTPAQRAVQLGAALLTVACWVGSVWLVWMLIRMAMGWV